MNTENCTDDFCVAPYASQPPLPSSSDYGVVGAKPAHRPSAAEEYKHYVYKTFYDSDGDITAKTVHQMAEERFAKQYSFSLVLKLRAAMSHNKWWRFCEPKRNVEVEGYPWENKND